MSNNLKRAIDTICINQIKHYSNTKTAQRIIVFLTSKKIKNVYNYM